MRWPAARSSRATDSPAAAGRSGRECTRIASSRPHVLHKHARRARAQLQPDLTRGPDRVHILAAGIGHRAPDTGGQRDVTIHGAVAKREYRGHRRRVVLPAKHDQHLVITEVLYFQCLAVGMAEPKLAPQRDQVLVVREQVAVRRPRPHTLRKARRLERRLGLRIGRLTFPMEPANSLRLPVRTASTSFASEWLTKYGKGAGSPNSSPMKRSGTNGDVSKRAAASRSAFPSTSAVSRSPRIRLPIWSWFCVQTTNCSNRASGAGAPCRRARYAEY